MSHFRFNGLVKFLNNLPQFATKLIIQWFLNILHKLVYLSFFFFFFFNKVYLSCLYIGEKICCLHRWYCNHKNDHCGIQFLKKHRFRHFYTKDLEHLKYFLEIEVGQSRTGITISQRSKDIFQMYQIWYTCSS